MKYGDFSSLVQLGVGLHVGTALLQHYSEIGVQPLIRTIARIKCLVEVRDEAEVDFVGELTKIESDFDIFRIRLFNEYKLFIRINSLVALALVGLLIYISYFAQAFLSVEKSVFMVALSVLPGPITLGFLWYGASKELTPLKARADGLEQRVLRGPEN